MHDTSGENSKISWARKPDHLDRQATRELVSRFTSGRPPQAEQHANCTTQHLSGHHADACWVTTKFSRNEQGQRLRRECRCLKSWRCPSYTQAAQETSSYKWRGREAERTRRRSVLCGALCGALYLCHSACDVTPGAENTAERSSVAQLVATWWPVRRRRDHNSTKCHVKPASMRGAVCPENERTLHTPLEIRGLNLSCWTFGGAFHLDQCAHAKCIRIQFYRDREWKIALRVHQELADVHVRFHVLQHRPGRCVICNWLENTANAQWSVSGLALL